MRKYWHVRILGAAVLLAAVVATAIVTLVHNETSMQTKTMTAADMRSLMSGSAPATKKTTPAPAASAPASGPRSSPVARNVPVPTKTATQTPAQAPARKPAMPTKPLTYTVKHGDNLTVIARWFKLHGYGALYERNRRVIGNDPDLIIPGQRITVSASGLTTSK